MNSIASMYMFSYVSFFVTIKMITLWSWPENRHKKSPRNRRGARSRFKMLFYAKGQFVILFGINTKK